MTIPNIQDLLKARNRMLKIVDTIRNLKEEYEKLEEQNCIQFTSDYYLNQNRYRHDDCKKLIDKGLWYAVIKLSKLTNSMTEKAKNDFLLKIEKDSPEFTVDELVGFSQNAINIYGKNIENTVKEVYKQLIGCKYRGPTHTLKESNLQRVEPKFRICGNIFHNKWPFGNTFQYRSTSWGFNFEDLLTACRLLDGKGWSDYSNNFECLCREQLKDSHTVITDYFTVTAYINGNQYVKFTRLDILEKLNRVGASGELPDVLKKKYKKEHFQGE